MWVTGIKTKFLQRAGNVLSHWVISSPSWSQHSFKNKQTNKKAKQLAPHLLHLSMLAAAPLGDTWCLAPFSRWDLVLPETAWGFCMLSQSPCFTCSATLEDTTSLQSSITSCSCISAPSSVMIPEPWERRMWSDVPFRIDHPSLSFSALCPVCESPC